MSGEVTGGIKRPLLHLVTLVQLLVLLPLVFGLYVFWPIQALSVLAGVLIEATGRAYFGFYAFRYSGAQRVALVLSSFKRGELGKFIIVAIMFGGVFFVFPRVAPLLLFAGFLVSWLLGALLSIRVLR